MTGTHRSEILTGAAVLLVAIAFVIYGAGIVGIGGGASRVSYSASFRSAEGISPGTDVRMSGVKVGTVSSLVLDPKTYRAQADFSIDQGIILPEDTAAIIASEGLLGGAFVELLPGGSPFDLEPGAEIIDTESAVSLVTLLMKFVAGGASEDAQ